MPGSVRANPLGRNVALSGTPGTGKSSVARLLPPRFRAVEVSDLALQRGVGRRNGKIVELDLRRLVRALRSSPFGPTHVYVGHLSHLLPVRDVILLRCHPSRLAERLGKARRGTARERQENFVAEATDLILLEAVRRRRRIWELDTTDLTPHQVAGQVRRILERPPRPHYGKVRWLEDPAVTEHLLGSPR